METCLQAERSKAPHKCGTPNFEQSVRSVRWQSDLILIFVHRRERIEHKDEEIDKLAFLLQRFFSVSFAFFVVKNMRIRRL